MDLHETIVNEKGETLYLRDLVNPPRKGAEGEGDDAERPDPPRFATRYWDEFSGKQRSLKDFFGGDASKKVPQHLKRQPSKAKKEVMPSLALPVDKSVDVTSSKNPAPPKAERSNSVTEPIIDLTNSTENSPVKPKRKTSSSTLPSIPRPPDTGKKRFKQPPQRTDSGPSQSSLATFFRPPASTASNTNGKTASRSSVTPTRPESAAPDLSHSPALSMPDQDSDYLFAKSLASAEEYTEYDAEDDGDVSLDQLQAVASWSSIFAKKVPPRCKVHNLPCKPFGEWLSCRSWSRPKVKIRSHENTRQEQGEKVLALLQVRDSCHPSQSVLMIGSPSDLLAKDGTADVPSVLERKSIPSSGVICESRLLYIGQRSHFRSLRLAFSFGLFYQLSLGFCCQGTGTGAVSRVTGSAGAISDTFTKLADAKHEEA